MISVDTKQKELVGDIKNGRGDNQPTGQPERVNVHDVPGNTDWVTVGTDHDTSAFAAPTGLHITVCHLPPGTSKWNKIEHRFFSQITMNWRGRPLNTHQVIVDLISNTTTATGLTVR